MECRDGAPGGARQRLSAIAEANIIVIAPPAVRGMSSNRRLQIHRPGPVGTGSAGAARRLRRADGGRRAGAWPDVGVLAVRGLDPAAVRGHRSGPRAGARRASLAGVRGPRGVPGVVVRERFQLSRPHVSGHRAGGFAVPTRREEHRRAPHAERRRRDGAARVRRHVSGRQRSDARDALQPVPGRRDPRRCRPRHIVRARGSSAMEALADTHAASRDFPTSGRSWRTSNSRRAARRGSCLRLPCWSSFSCSPASMKA